MAVCRRPSSVSAIRMAVRNSKWSLVRNKLEIKPMGQLPLIFDGDRTKSEAFLDTLKAYFCLNHQVPTFNSYLTRIALALMLIQGPLVQEWTRTLRDWLDDRDPLQEDEKSTWDQFTHQFMVSFMVTQKDQRAQNQLENLKMKWPEIDQYIMDFEKLSREASYDIGSPASIHQYLKGLPYNVAKDVLSPPLVHTYTAILKRVVESVKSQELLKAMSKNQGNGRSAFQQNWRSNNNGPCNSNQQTSNQFNSSNTPRSHNNTPVPMDLSRAKGNR